MVAVDAVNQLIRLTSEESLLSTRPTPVVYCVVNQVLVGMPYYGRLGRWEVVVDKLHFRAFKLLVNDLHRRKVRIDILQHSVYEVLLILYLHQLRR